MSRAGSVPGIYRMVGLYAEMISLKTNLHVTVNTVKTTSR